MTAPRVSIIMPARNAARWLHQAIESILVQTFAAFELIIVDDGSNDDTPAILAGLQRVDERICVHVNVIVELHESCPEGT